MEKKTDETPFEVKVAGEGILIETKISQAKARAVINIVMSMEPDTTSDDYVHDLQKGRQSPHTDQDGPPLSVREFLDNVSATSNSQMITVFGQYITENENRQLFDKSSVKSKFGAAGEPLPANFNRDFQSAVSAGWIAEMHDQPDQFYITNTGKKALEGGFKSDARVKSSRRPARGRSKRDEDKSQVSNSEEVTDAAGTKRRRASGTGAISTLLTAIDDGFLNEKRTIREICGHCADRYARGVKANEISGKLGALVRDGTLKRSKNSDGQYEYSTR